MRFVEMLRQKLALETQAQEQLTKQLEVEERERYQRRLQGEAVERARHEQRRRQALEFREKSRVGITVTELGRFLAIPTIPVRRISYEDGKEIGFSEEHIGRGSSSGLLYTTELPILRKDPDSIFDIARWDKVKTGTLSDGKGGFYTHYPEKYIVVETCPDGTIVFHAGSRSSTTIPVVELRTNDKEQILDEALKKAFNDPGHHLTVVQHLPVGPLLGGF